MVEGVEDAEGEDEDTAEHETTELALREREEEAVGVSAAEGEGETAEVELVLGVGEELAASVTVRVGQADDVAMDAVDIAVETATKVDDEVAVVDAIAELLDTAELDGVALNEMLGVPESVLVAVMEGCKVAFGNAAPPTHMMANVQG